MPSTTYLAFCFSGNGYGFALNTYIYVSMLAPVARYNASYARALGKYGLNAINAARFFLPNYTDPNHQTDWGWNVCTCTVCSNSDASSRMICRAIPLAPSSTRASELRCPTATPDRMPQATPRRDDVVGVWCSALTNSKCTLTGPRRSHQSRSVWRFTHWFARRGCICNG